MRIFVRHERLTEFGDGKSTLPSLTRCHLPVLYSNHVCFPIIGLSEKLYLNEVLLFTHMFERLKENKDERKGS
jgi:hypothetical protein